MKNQILAIVALMVLILAAPVWAQTGGIKAEVPFDFGVRGKTLPAGEYSVKKALDDNGQGMVWMLTSEEDSIVILAKARRDPEADDQISLSFNRYGDSYFLSGFIVPGTRIELPSSNEEGEAAERQRKNLAENRSPESARDTVVVLATLD